MSLERVTVPTEVTHYNIQPTIELTLGVYGRDLGHVSDDVTKVLDKFGNSGRAREMVSVRPGQQGEKAAAGLDDRALAASTCG